MRLPADLDARSLSDLRALVIALVVKGTELERTVAAQRDEIARLKGLKGRPQIKPSGMEKASQALTQERATGKRRRKRAKSADLTIHEERILKAGPVPPGSRFKGYQTFVVQDLVLRPHVVRLRRERWLAPDGQTIMAAMPSEIVGHFGLGLRRFVLAQYHQGQVTIPRLLEQLSSLGLRISKRQLVRFLIAGQDGFVDEARAVLRAGLSGAAWISVDDTGARHRGANQVCTQIGNDHFTWFGTSASKSRVNFLELLRAGHTDYVINPEALAYMRSRALAGPVIAKLASHPAKHFADEAAWKGHLERLGLGELTVSPDPVRIATEGALWGAIKAHGFLPDTVIVSDDAGQFMVGRHALCRVGGDVAIPAPQSGRIEARTGLRMMPTFPRSPLSFRTAGFPQYGWKAGLSGGAFPDRQRLKPAPGMRLLTPGLPSPFVHLRVGAVVPYCAGPLTCRCTALEGGSPSAPGALARVRVMLSRSVLA